MKLRTAAYFADGYDKMIGHFVRSFAWGEGRERARQNTLLCTQIRKKSLGIIFYDNRVSRFRGTNVE